MKPIGLLLSFTLLLCACGKDTLTLNTPVSRKSENLVASNLQVLFDSLPEPGLSVEIDNTVGTSQTQRQKDGIFCRKIGAVVQNPVYRYECWKSEMTNDRPTPSIIL